MQVCTGLGQVYVPVSLVISFEYTVLLLTREHHSGSSKAYKNIGSTSRAAHAIRNANRGDNATMEGFGL